MENVVLVIHLLLALALIVVVLLQRSEGGGLGMGGGGGGNVMSGRGAATALSKITWGLAVAFIITSITLTVFATRTQQGSSVIDRLGTEAPAGEQQDAPLLPPGLEGGSLLPPSSGDAPALPPVAE